MKGTSSLNPTNISLNISQTMNYVDINIKILITFFFAWAFRALNKTFLQMITTSITTFSTFNVEIKRLLCTEVR